MMFKYILVVLLISIFPKGKCDYLTDKANLATYMENYFSKGRSHEQYDQKVVVREDILQFFNDLQAVLPSAIVDTQQYNTTRWKDGLNLIYIVPGSRWGTSEDQISLVGAHYDSQVNTPGVDDNGSGMATLFEAARVATGVASAGTCALMNTIIFVAFDHEETSLSGSKHFVDDYLVPTILAEFNVADFRGAYILETIANYNDSRNTQIVPTGLDLLFPEQYQQLVWNEFRGDWLSCIIRQDDIPFTEILSRNWYRIVGGSNFTDTEKYRQMTVPIPASGNPLFWDPLFQLLVSDLFRSDHYQFWNHISNYTIDGLKAVFITDTAEFRGEMQACYHNPCDDTGMITDDNMSFLQNIAESIVRSLLGISTDDESLQCLENDIQFV